MPNTSRSRPAVGRLLEPLYDEYASRVVVVFDAGADDSAPLVALQRKPSA